ncbi:hypothetical protein [Moraxella lacunata]|uniref:hypothetical protein n=1 Tax=Moraxella lacunata TaxID=477 RepID=UPI003EE2CB8E
MLFGNWDVFVSLMGYFVLKTSPFLRLAFAMKKEKNRTFFKDFDFEPQSNHLTVEI